MRIKEMTATFGRLDNQTITFGPGLNVIEAPNEGGKSTAAAFLCAMLYGLNTRDRSPLADKRRYLPWSGKAMAGRLVLDCPLGEVTLLRSTTGEGAPIGSFSAVYTGTGTPVPQLTAANCGETLTGVSREVFLRSAFIRQAGVALDGSPALVQHVTAALTSDGGETAFGEAAQRLKKQLNRRRHNRTGLLPQTEEELRALAAQLEELDELEQALAQCRRQREEEPQLPPLEELEALRGRLEALEEEARRLEELEEETALAESNVTEAEDALRAHPFSPHAPAQAEALPLGLGPRPRLRPLTAVLCALLGAAAAGVVLYFSGALMPALGCALGLTGLGLQACSLPVRRRQRQWDETHSRLQREREEALRVYATLYNRAQEARWAAAAARAALERLSADHAHRRAELERRAAGLCPGTTVEQALAQRRRWEESALALRRREQALLGRMEAAGQRQALEDRLAQTRTRHSRLQREYEAISLAAQTLEEAHAALQNQFSPELGEKSAKIFTKLTGGKYNKVLLDASLSPSAGERELFLPREAALLSQGTADQLYLALRLAICQTALPPHTPLVLDDALVHFDDRRCALALDYLAQLSHQRQILLFTCQKREAAYLRETAGHPIHVINF